MILMTPNQHEETEQRDKGGGVEEKLGGATTLQKALPMSRTGGDVLQASKDVRGWVLRFT